MKNVAVNNYFSGTPGIALLKRKKAISIYATLFFILFLETSSVALYFSIQDILKPVFEISPNLLSTQDTFKFALIFLTLIFILSINQITNATHPLNTLQPQFSKNCFNAHIITFIAFLFMSSRISENSYDLNRQYALWAPWLLMVALYNALLIRSFAAWPQILSWLKYNTYNLLIAVSLSILVLWVSSLSQYLWLDLNKITFSAVEAILSLIYPVLTVDTSVFLIGPPEFVVEITPECSGYEGMGLIAAFLLFYVWLYRNTLKLPEAFAIFPIGLFVIWFANVVRIVILIAIGQSWSRSLALNGFHSQAGWIAFIAVAILLIWIMNRFWNIENIKAPTAIKPTHIGLAEAFILPFLVILSLQIIFSALTENAELFYPIKIIAGAGILWTYRKQYKSILPLDKSSIISGTCIGGALFLCWWAITGATTKPLNSPPIWLIELPAEYAIIWLAIKLTGSTLVVPAAEELLFRGYLIRKLATTHFELTDTRQISWFAWLVSSLLFGFLHQQWLAGFLAGLAFAYAQYRQGKLMAAVIAHMVTNGLIAISVLFFGQWVLWF